MSDPLITPDDLGTYLSDRGIDSDRAEMMISYAQALCEGVLSPPLPANAAVVVTRVAARGYVTTLSSRRQQMTEAGSPYGSGGNGIFLTQEDRDDLALLSGGGGEAFTINLLPDDYSVTLPPWDVNGCIV